MLLFVQSNIPFTLNDSAKLIQMIKLINWINYFQIHRQTGRTSRHNGENPVPNFLPILTSEARVTWEGHLETEQLEVCNRFSNYFHELCACIFCEIA